MKNRFVYLIVFFNIIIICFLVFPVSSDNQKELITYSKVNREKDLIEEKLDIVEAGLIDDIYEEDISNEVDNNQVEEDTNQNNDSIENGNYIRINNVLYNNLMSDDGSNFYLNHNLNGEYDGIGIPYVDFRNDFTGRKTIIYSHSSMNGDGPFQALQQYDDNKSFYDNNKYITISYNGNIYNYLIFSVYVSMADSEESPGLEYFHNMNYTDSLWGITINDYKNNSIYDTGVSVNENDKIVILQTCSMNPNYYKKAYRYNLLIMGKLI